MDMGLTAGVLAPARQSAPAQNGFRDLADRCRRVRRCLQHGGAKLMRGHSRRIRESCPQGCGRRIRLALVMRAGSFADGRETRRQANCLPFRRVRSRAWSRPGRHTTRAAAMMDGYSPPILHGRRLRVTVPAGQASRPARWLPGHAGQGRPIPLRPAGNRVQSRRCGCIRRESRAARAAGAWLVNHAPARPTARPEVVPAKSRRAIGAAARR